MSAPFHIYRSSAGSGKTYTLSRAYLKLALIQPNAFRNILGVTFTNKASQEMKRRIMRFLNELKAGTNPELANYLASELGLTISVIQQKAEATLTDILHQYGRFSIVTIDSFFHQVIRSFAREMSLQGTFTIDLDLNKVIQEIIDKMLQEIGDEDRKQLRIWLTQFAESKVEEGKSWDFRKDISGLAKEILKDNFRISAPQILKLKDDPSFFVDFKKELGQTRFSFENKIANICSEANQIIQRLGIDPFDFKGGSRTSPALIFNKIAGKKYELTKTQRLQYGNTTDWIKANDPKSTQLQLAIDEGLSRCFDQIIDAIDQEFIHYNSAIEVNRNFFTFGILTELNGYLQQYRDENDVMLIADLPVFLRQIIHDSDTPYIYEKVGSQYHHYLIDEFQDTSTFQWDNFKPLVKNATDSGQFCMVVGDVKQSIYRFRGGDWELLQGSIKSDIGKEQSVDVFLGTNYRSAAGLIAFNNSFFNQMVSLGKSHFTDSLDQIGTSEVQDLIAKQIEFAFATYQDVSQEHPKGKQEGLGTVGIDFISEEDMDDGERWTAEAIRRTISQVEEFQRKGYALRDMAILTRFTGEGRKIANAFIDYRNSDQADNTLRYEVVSTEALYLTSSHLVRFIVSLIKWLNDESNTIVLSEWLYEYHHYILKSGREETSIFSSIVDWKEQVPSIFVKQKPFLKTLPLYELVEGIIRMFELDRVKEEFTYLQGFQDAILDYSKNERGDIPSFLDWWEEIRKDRAIQMADENDAIKIMTIHKAKGLEFPVVLLPFLGWSLDHESTKDTILWCKGGDQAPFNRLPQIPLKYSQGLVNTYWASEYYQERLKVFLDNLNLLYVAFTRPVEVLWGFAPLPKRTEFKSINHLIFAHVNQHPAWNEDRNMFRLGELTEASIPAKATIEFGLENYHSHPWRGKVSLQIKGSAELNEEAFIEATQQGIELHQILSRVKYQVDLNQFENLKEFAILKALVTKPDISGWFDTRWQVDTEVPVLLPGGDFKRIDRINRTKEETVVIDFKTGSKRDKDQQQVQEYKIIMKEMGYPNVHGVLIYLGAMEVVIV